MKEKSLHISGYNERHVNNRFYCQSESNNKLAVMFPGIAYTNDKPVLYYSKELFIQKGYDVLDIEFDYLKNKDFLFLSHYRKEIVFEEDIEGILNELNNLNYREVIFNAKSMGTKAMAQIHNRLHFDNIKIIWQTPLLEDEIILKEMIKTNYTSLAIIGTDDQNYQHQLIRKLLKNEKFTFFEVEGVNHSYDSQDSVFDSIEKCKLIIHRIEDFLYK